MQYIVNSPFLVFVIAVFGLWAVARIGVFARQRSRPLDEDERHDLDVVGGASLGLLGLLIAFSFSMAISHYDQRKNHEEDEANAIGTEYVRVNLLMGTDAASLQDLLRKYLDQRVRFYEVRSEDRLAQIDADTSQLQNQLWSTAQSAAQRQSIPVVGLTLSGMNDVLNSEGYTQAAWWNRIPIAAWTLLALIAICCSLLIGYSMRRSTRIVILVLPLTVAISFFLIADIDSPRGGLIRVPPKNLLRLSHSLK